MGSTTPPAANFARLALWAMVLTLFVLSQLLAAAPPPASAPAPVPAPAAAPAVDAPPAPGALPAAAEAGKPLLDKQRDRYAIIRIDREIDDMMLASVKRRVFEAQRLGCDLIVVEIDSPGGYVTSCLALAKYLKSLPLGRPPMTTVAWVHSPSGPGGMAYSGGAMTALACKYVLMAPMSAIGDCAPIQVGAGGIQPMGVAERAKQESPIVQEFRESAEINGFNPVLGEAMVVPSVEVHEVRNNLTGEARYVDTAEKDRLINTMHEVDDGHGQKVKRPLWSFVSTVDGANSLLTVSGENAVKMGLARRIVADEPQLRAALNVTGEPVVMDMNWAEKATIFLTAWWVRGFLFVAMLVFAYVEFSHPGLSVPGVLALVCLLLLVIAPFLTGLAQAWEIILIALGVGIIIVDLVLYGGIGLLALPGFVLMAVGLVASFVPSDPGGGFLPRATQLVALQKGLGVVLFGSIFALGIFFFLSRYLYMTPGFRRLQLAPVAPVPSAPLVAEAAQRDMVEAVFTGALGKAISDLRPAGKARFGQHLVDVMTDGQYVTAGTVVEVQEVSGTRILVRPARATPPDRPQERTA